MCVGKVTDYQNLSKKSENNAADVNIFLQIIEFTFNIFLNLQKIREKGSNSDTNQNNVSNSRRDSTKDKLGGAFKKANSIKSNSSNTNSGGSNMPLLNMIRSSLYKHSKKEQTEPLTVQNLLNYCQIKLCNLDAYVRLYFSKIFLNARNSFNTAFPHLTLIPNFLTVENYFCFCLSNANLFSK